MEFTLTESDLSLAIEIYLKELFNVEIKETEKINISITKEPVFYINAIIVSTE